MKKHVFGRQFKRDANERKALFKNLLTSLVVEERIRTTEAKAKAVKGAADKLITTAKKKGDNAARFLYPRVNQKAVTKLIQSIAPRFANRQGGYTRIIRDRRRVADNAQMVYLGWTERVDLLEKGNMKVEKGGKKQEEGKIEQKATEQPNKPTILTKLRDKAKRAKEPVQKQIRTKRGDK